MKSYDGPGAGRKQCPKCQTFRHIAQRVCECGHEFYAKPEPKPRPAPVATLEAVVAPAAPAVVPAPQPASMTRDDFLGRAILSIIHQQHGNTMLGWRSFGDLCELAGSAFVAWRAVSGARDEELWALKREFQEMQAYYSGPWLEKDPHRTRGGDFGDGVPMRDRLRAPVPPTSLPPPNQDRSAGFRPGAVPTQSPFPEVSADLSPDDHADFEAWEEAAKTAGS